MRLADIKERASKSWAQVTPEQGAALSKALLIIGLGLLTKPLLDMWPSIASTMVRGAMFAVVIILFLRMVQIMPTLNTLQIFMQKLPEVTPEVTIFVVSQGSNNAEKPSPKNCFEKLPKNSVENRGAGATI